MRRLLAIVVVVLAIAACSGGGSDGDSDVGAITYQLLASDGDGSFADYEGRPLVVNFFGSWCAPCTTEMPAFQRVHEEYGDRVAFLGLAVNDTVDDALGIVEQTGVTWDLGRDPRGELVEELGGIGMPTTVLIDDRGRLLEAHTGELSSQELTEMIEEHFFS